MDEWMLWEWYFLPKSPFKSFTMTLPLRTTIHPARACSWQQHQNDWIHYPDWVFLGCSQSVILTWQGSILRHQESVRLSLASFTSNEELQLKSGLECCYRNTQTSWRQSFLLIELKTAAAGWGSGWMTATPFPPLFSVEWVNAWGAPAYFPTCHSMIDIVWDLSSSSLLVETEWLNMVASSWRSMGIKRAMSVASGWTHSCF